MQIVLFMLTWLWDQLPNQSIVCALTSLSEVGSSIAYHHARTWQNHDIVVSHRFKGRDFDFPFCMRYCWTNAGPMTVNDWWQKNGCSLDHHIGFAEHGFTSWYLKSLRIFKYNFCIVIPSMYFFCLPDNSESCSDSEKMTSEEVSPCLWMGELCSSKDRHLLTDFRRVIMLLKTANEVVWPMHQRIQLSQNI